MIGPDAQAMLLERESGEMLASVAQRHGVTTQRVSAIVRDATEFVNRMELDLMVARKTDEQCIYVVPFSEHYVLAVAFGDWLIHRLRERGLRLHVETRRAS